MPSREVQKLFVHSSCRWREEENFLFDEKYSISSRMLKAQFSISSPLHVAAVAVVVVRQIRTSFSFMISSESYSHTGHSLIHLSSMQFLFLFSHRLYLVVCLSITTSVFHVSVSVHFRMQVLYLTTLTLTVLSP